MAIGSAKKKPVITPVQLVLLSVGSSIMFPYTFMPVLRTPPANQDSWIVSLLTFVYILILNAPFLFLMNRFRGLSINEMAETILGRVFGKLACLIFIGLFLFCYAACMLMGAMFVNIFILQETPRWAILLYTAVPVVYAVYKGAGSIGRLAAFITPLVILTVIIFFLMGIKKMDFTILQPILADSTVLELNQGAFLTASRYSEITILVVFSQFLRQKASVNKIYASALVLYGISFLLIVIPTVTVLGTDLAKHSWNPYFTYTRQVEAYDFIQRVQSINVVAWFMGMILKSSAYCYMASYVLSGVVKAKSHKPFIIPLSAAALIVCMLPFMDKTTTIELLRSDRVFPWIVVAAVFVPSVIMAVVYFFRRKTVGMIVKQKLAAGTSAETEQEN